MNRDHKPRFSVRIQPAVAMLGFTPEHSHAWFVEDAEARMSHCGYAPDRSTAWKLALATLRGMIALARVRRNAA